MSHVINQTDSLTLLSPFLYNLIVGKLLILVCSSSLTVESILAITTVSSLANFSPNYEGKYLCDTIIQKNRRCEGMAYFLINWSQLFAVSAPWGVKFNQHILLSIKNDFVKIGCDEDFDGVLVPILWEILAQHVLL